MKEVWPHQVRVNLVNNKQYTWWIYFGGHSFPANFPLVNYCYHQYDKQRLLPQWPEKWWSKCWRSNPAKGRARLCIHTRCSAPARTADSIHHQMQTRAPTTSAGESAVPTAECRKACQQFGSWAKLWRMISSRARQSTAAISKGRTCWLDSPTFLWKRLSERRHRFRAVQILHFHFTETSALTIKSYMCNWWLGHLTVMTLPCVSVRKVAYYWIILASPPAVLEGESLSNTCRSAKAERTAFYWRFYRKTVVMWRLVYWTWTGDSDWVIAEQYRKCLTSAVPKSAVTESFKPSRSCLQNLSKATHVQHSVTANSKPGRNRKDEMNNEGWISMAAI